jgi:hypothetical protein
MNYAYPDSIFPCRSGAYRLSYLLIDKATTRRIAFIIAKLLTMLGERQ